MSKSDIGRLNRIQDEAANGYDGTTVEDMESYIAFLRGCRGEIDAYIDEMECMVANFKCNRDHAMAADNAP